VHFQRNLLARVSKTNMPVVSAVVKTVFAEKDRDQAHVRWREVADNLRDRFRDVVELMDEAEYDVLAYGVRAISVFMQSSTNRRKIGIFAANKGFD
jgi:transposase-like protein